MVFSSFKTGTSWMWKNKRIVLFYYIFNLLFGILLMLPVRASLSRYLDSSFMGKQLGGMFNMDFLFEFLVHNKNVGPVVISMPGVVAVLYWLANLFLSGGTLSMAASGKPYSATDFWGNNARFFGRFFRLFLWSLPLILVIIFIHFIEAGLERLFFGSDPYQYITYWGKWVKVGLRAFAIFFYMMVFDYARIYTVITDERKMRYAIWEGINFFRKNFGNVFMLAFAIALIGYISVFIYNPLANMLSTPNSFVILTLLLLQQLYMFFRMMIRVTLLASEVQLYSLIDRQPAGEAVPPVADSEFSPETPGSE